MNIVSENGILNTRDSSVLFEDSALFSNYANDNSLINAINTDIRILNSDFSSNDGSKSGIIMNMDSGSLSLDNSVFSDNHSGQDCSCINIVNSPSLNMTRLIIKDNTSKTNGGFGCITDSDTIITDSSFKRIFNFLNYEIIILYLKEIE